MATFIKIASYTVGAGGTTSFTFSNIPQTYTDLCLKISDRGNRSGTFYSNTSIKINNDGSLIYDWNWLRNYSGTVSGLSSTNDYDLSWYSSSSAGDASTFGNTEIYIPNYTSSNYKSISYDSVVEQNSTSCFNLFAAYLYRSTNAITSLVVTGSANNYTIQENSTYTLYGISKS